MKTKRIYGVEIETCCCKSHNAPRRWERQYEHCGLEFVSPLLSGEEGLNSIRELYRRIKPQVNTACGLHVHIDVRDFTDFEKMELVKRLIQDKRLFTNKVDPARLYNYFCRGDLPKLCGDATFHDYTSRLEGDRYCWVNLLSVRKHGSIEFRLHEATENAEEVCGWVKFLVTYVENVKNGITITECPADVNKMDINKRVNMLVSNLWWD